MPAGASGRGSALAHALPDVYDHAFTGLARWMRRIVRVDALPQLLDLPTQPRQCGHGLFAQRVTLVHFECPGRAADEIAQAGPCRTGTQLGDHGGNHRLEVIQHGSFPAVRLPEGDLEQLAGKPPLVPLAGTADAPLGEEAIEGTLALLGRGAQLLFDFLPGDGACAIYREPYEPVPRIRRTLVDSGEILSGGRAV